MEGSRWSRRSRRRGDVEARGTPLPTERAASDRAAASERRRDPTAVIFRATWTREGRAFFQDYIRVNMGNIYFFC